MDFIQRMKQREAKIYERGQDSAKFDDPNSSHYIPKKPETKVPQGQSTQGQINELQDISQDMVNLAASLAESANINSQAIQSLLSETEIKDVFGAKNSNQHLPDADALMEEQQRILQEQRKLEESINKPVDIKKTSQTLASDPEATGEPPFISNMKDEKKVTSANKVEETVDEEPKVIPKLLTRASISQLSTNLKKRVFGQDEVIEEVVNILKSAFVSLKVNKKKPAGSYFFAGPSGVGKTELAKTLADSLGVNMLVINMGEYALEHEVAKLLGAPPGYLGYEAGGVIPNFIAKNPRGIILFDEIEKAHESADNILLSIMDQGVCQDNKGKDILFKETIIIATSNLGARVEYIQGLTQEEKNEERMNAIKEKLRPEIIGRYDSIFHFHSLKPDIYMKIVNKFLNGISESAKEEHQINLTFSDAIRDLIATKSFDPALGGRPAGKFIEKVVVLPFADFMLRDDFEAQLAENPDIVLDLNEDGNVCFRGKDNVVLGVQENTADIITRIENTSFSKPKNFKIDPADAAITELPKVSLKSPVKAPAPAKAPAKPAEVKKTPRPRPA